MSYSLSHPFPDDEQSALAEAQRSNITDVTQDEPFDDIIKLCLKLFKVEISLVSITSDERRYFSSKVGLAADDSARKDAFCKHTMLSENVMIIPDARKDMRFHNHAAVIGFPHIKFYAGATLTTASGAPIGTLCLADSKPRDSFDLDDTGQLIRLAKIVTIEICKTISKSFYLG
jgi:GAF domain-containing protein